MGQSFQGIERTLFHIKERISILEEVEMLNNYSVISIKCIKSMMEGKLSSLEFQQVELLLFSGVIIFLITQEKLRCILCQTAGSF